MRIGENLKKCVVFIGRKWTEGGVECEKYLGTAFIVSVPSKVSNRKFLFLVTAKHVAVAISNKDGFIRVNTKSGGSESFDLGNISWFYHPDEVRTSDVAVYPFLLGNGVIAKFEIEPVPIVCFMTDEARVNQGIGEGDEVCIIGLFSKHTGTRKNLPLVRSGTIAMISDELVPTQKFGSLEAYLIEARSIKGISGSPVFVLKQGGFPVADGKEMIPSNKVFVHLLGLMHGHWDLAPEESIDVGSGLEGEGSVNMGIAIVIPAKHILEALNQKGISEFKAKIEEQWLAKNSLAAT